MKWKKGLAAVILASVALAACGAEKDQVQEQEAVEQEVTEIEMVEENEQFRTFITGQMPDFIKDAELLASLVEEGKLEEAQKLLPLVTMYYERLQPLVDSLGKIDATLNGPLEKGKEADATGFQKLAHGLFVEQTTEGYSGTAKKIVVDVKSLDKQLAAMNVGKNNVLDGALEMLNQTINKRLPTNSVADTELYAVKAQTEAVDELVKIFMARADSTKAAEVVQATTALNEVLAFYEIGKQDYIKYSLFTNTQKQELVDAVKTVDSKLQDMIATVK